MGVQPNAAQQARAAQAQALSDIGLQELRGQLAEIRDIVLAAQRNGLEGLTRSEIRARWEQLTSRRREESTVAGRVAELISAQRLVQLEQPRECTVTGRIKTVVAVPAQQARLLP